MSSHPNSKYEFNRHAFDEPLSAEAKYWIGFLMADGSIGSKNNSIRMTLSLKDEIHLHKFRNFIKTNAPFHYPKTLLKGKSYTGIKLQLNCKYLCNRLSHFGVVPNKSLVAQVKNLEDSIDFWRGVIDGDGCLFECSGNVAGYPMLVLVGSKTICNQFADFVKKRLIDYLPTVRKFKHSQAFEARVNGEAAMWVAQVLYRNCCIALDRKLEVANRWNARWIEQPSMKYSEYFEAYFKNVAAMPQKKIKVKTPMGEYNSIVDAALAYHISEETISRRCGARIGRRKLDGWDYIDG